MIGLREKIVENPMIFGKSGWCPVKMFDEFIDVHHEFNPFTFIPKSDSFAMASPKSNLYRWIPGKRSMGFTDEL